MLDKGDIAAKIAHIAERQWGHVTRGQLLKLGVPSRTITEWLDRRTLVPVHAGVYALGHAEQTGLARAMAAVLACGEHAVVSHSSAAALWDLRPWPAGPEITAPLDHRRAGIRTHRSTTLTRHDIRRRHNIPVTSPARTILDLSPHLTDHQLVRLINDARLADHLGPTALDRLTTTSPRINRLIDGHNPPTRSHFEDRFRRFCAAHHLPTPATNQLVAGHEVDVLFADHKLIVELDGWDFHNTRQSFESDRQRDIDTAAAGYLTIRLTWAAITQRPADIARQLRTILDRRRG